MPRYKEIDQTNLMLQVDLANQLLPDTFEHALNTIIESRIDTRVFDDQYQNDETGATAYNPKTLLKIILFAYSKGILSSRKIETACNENIIFMALSGDLHPDHSTIADFVSKQCRPIKEIFTQVLFLCAQMDLIDMEYLAVDGSKISSNAAKEHSGTHGELKKKKKKLQRKVDKLLTRHAADLLPEILNGLPSTLEAASVEKHLTDATLLADTAYHTAENLKELDAKGIDAVIPDNKFRSCDERFEERAEVSRKDGGGKIKSEDFTYDPASNEYTCPQGQVLRFHADQKNGNRNRAVYRSDPGSCTGCPRAGDCFRATPKERRQLTITSKSEGLQLMKDMRNRIDSDEGRQIYSKRMEIVEPVFANIKVCKGMNYFTLRGEQKVNIQWTLFALVHNIEKLLTSSAVAKLG